jgi:hypothetical protein
MPINKKLQISNEHFGDNDFLDIIHVYLVKMFNISNSDYELF